MIFTLSKYTLIFVPSYLHKKLDILLWIEQNIFPALFPVAHTIKSFVKVELASMEGHLQRKPF